MSNALKCPFCSETDAPGKPMFTVEMIKHISSVEYRVICAKCGNIVYRPRLDRKRLNCIYSSVRPLKKEDIQEMVHKLLKSHGKKMDKARFFAMYLERDPEFSEYLECEFDYKSTAEGIANE